MAAIIANS